MRSDPIIREALPSDAENLAALSIQVWLHTYATDGLRSSISSYVLTEFTPAAFLAILADPGRALLVAELNNHIIGYALVATDLPCPNGCGASCELATLYVQEHFAGRGIGTVLLAESRRAARSRVGDARLWLTVWVRNERAIAFYAKHGFVHAGISPIEFGGETHENHLLVEPI